MFPVAGGVVRYPHLVWGFVRQLSPPWPACLLYADAVVSPAGTGLIYTTVSACVSYAMARNRNAPAALERTNHNGVPVAGLVLTFVIGLILTRSCSSPS